MIDENFSNSTISVLMQQSGVAFGTSGARGLVSAMTDKVCFAYTVGFLQYLTERGEFFSGQKVAVAGDLRPSSERIKRACLAAIQYCGGIAVDCGEVPTPALCYYAYGLGIPSMMVTGSHIPDDRNGIKFNRAHGEFLKIDEMMMREERVKIPENFFDTEGMLCVGIADYDCMDVSDLYIARYVDFFGSEALRGVRLGVYEHSAVGRDIVIRILSGLNADVVRLGRSDVFIPVDTEAVREEDVILAKNWANENDLYAILTTDGDSDRPLLADEKGEWIRGDVLGIVAAQFLSAQGVVTPISSNTALERAGFATVTKRTRIGSPFVISAMTELSESGQKPIVGYEANGGFLLNDDITNKDEILSALPTRDAVLPMLCAVIASRQQGKLSEFMKNLPQRYTLSDRIKEMPTSISESQLEMFNSSEGMSVAENIFGNICGKSNLIDHTDGVRISFDSEEIIHLRPSGNAPELRVYVEAASIERANTILHETMKIVLTWKSR